MRFVYCASLLLTVACSSSAGDFSTSGGGGAGSPAGSAGAGALPGGAGSGQGGLGAAGGAIGSAAGAVGGGAPSGGSGGVPSGSGGSAVSGAGEGAVGGAAGSGGSIASGGAGSAGTGGTQAGPSFYLGADITDQETAPSAAQDNLLSQMKAHGFNYVRLRTFVDPKASDGYDQTNGFDDIAHTVAFGKRIKDAGMGLLVDFHYSDNWADPGKQCIPVAWQGFTTIVDLAAAMQSYTKDAIQKLVAGGARPDMVQIGNETTPGMLLHHCDSGGQPMKGVTPAVTGSTSNWKNLGTLLNAGVAGVKAVDANILISLHIDRGNSFSASKSWIDNAVKQNVAFDAFGESCYQTYQGDPNSVANTVDGWTTTFTQLVAAYPKLKFFAAEYGPMEREINDVLFKLPNQQGIGTFDWEPTTQGSWNAVQPSDPPGTGSHALFTRSGSTYSTRPDLALYDLMKTAYASRL